MTATDTDLEAPEEQRAGGRDRRLGPEGVVESFRAHPADCVSHAAGDSELFVVKLLRADRVQRQAYSRLASRFLAAGRRLLVSSPAHPGQVLEVGEEAAGAFEYTPAYLPVNRLLDGTMHDW